MRTAIVNIGTIVSGDWARPILRGDTILTEDGRISRVGTAAAEEVESCDIVIDAGGATAIPGLIDSHVHITFGDYTPRQQTVGYLESYVHGGVTTAISASEVHVPGRPRDPEGVKALAVAAHKCFESYRPEGMTVHAGSVILEPGLSDDDLGEIAGKGVWLAKAGFGAFASAYDYAPLIAAARAHNMITTVHTGGSSIPGSGAITGDHLLALKPHVSFHVNGGPTAMPDKDFARLIHESDVALQICTAGNLRTTLLCARLAWEADAFARLIIATDTPTGSGVMPLGMLYTIAHLSSLAGIAPEVAIAAATGSNARVYRLESGLLSEGGLADIVLIDAPDGGTQADALSAIRHGDIAAIGAVVAGGEPRFVGRSRNTPATTRKVRVAKCTLPRDFSGARH
ncbi:amidohydrolase family protein [Pseudorhodoplanes sp.]|uniref:amidohydrolase family protein n=1 Tax=Pseudorhodoplanes sp. TaxID=1934341 RepID=UPI003D0E46B2